MTHVERARLTLLTRARRSAMRARRARAGSHEREKAIGQAAVLSACVQELDTDKKLQAGITKAGWDEGWRPLADRVLAYVRTRDKISPGRLDV